MIRVGGGFGHFLDQAAFHETLECAVQRAGTEPYFSLGLFKHVFEDAVAVTLALGEREQDVEDRRGQGHCSGGKRGQNV